LPPTVSRHNSAGQPNNITSALKKHLTHTSKASTGIVVLWDTPDSMFSSVCAVSRIGGGLLYSRKTSSATATVADGHHHHPHTQSTSPVVLGGISISETALPSLNHLRVLFPPSTVTKADQERLSNVALGVQLTRRLVDAPCNELDTVGLEEQAESVVHGLRYVSMRSIKGEQLHQLGYGGLYHVGKAGTYVCCSLVYFWLGLPVLDLFDSWLAPFVCISLSLSLSLSPPKSRPSAGVGRTELRPTKGQGRAVGGVGWEGHRL
jgi:probable aminopeptidase NPEPL1